MRHALTVVLLVVLTGCAPAGEEAAEVVTEVDTERVGELESEVAALTEERDDAEASLERLREAAKRSREAVEEAAEPTPTPETDGTAAFGESFTYVNDLTVMMSQPVPFTPSGTAATGDESSFVSFDVTVTNDGVESYDPTLFSVSVQSGGSESDSVVDIQQSVDGFAPQTAVLPGRSVTWTAAFGVDDAADIVVEMNPGFEYDSVVFTGSAGAAAEGGASSAAAPDEPEPVPVEEEPYDHQCPDGTWQPDASGCAAAAPVEAPTTGYCSDGTPAPCPETGMGAGEDYGPEGRVPCSVDPAACGMADPSDGEGGVPGAIDTAPGYDEDAAAHDEAVGDVVCPGPGCSVGG